MLAIILVLGRSYVSTHIETDLELPFIACIECNRVQPPQFDYAKAMLFSLAWGLRIQKPMGCPRESDAMIRRPSAVPPNRGPQRLVPAPLQLVAQSLSCPHKDIFAAGLQPAVKSLHELVKETLLAGIRVAALFQEPTQ